MSDAPSTVTVGNESAVLLDCRGMLCPVPIIRLSKAVKAAEIGQLVKLLATDPGSEPDLKAWKQTGHTSSLRRAGRDPLRRAARQWQGGKEAHARSSTSDPRRQAPDRMATPIYLAAAAAAMIWTWHLLTVHGPTMLRKGVPGTVRVRSSTETARSSGTSSTRPATSGPVPGVPRPRSQRHDHGRRHRGVEMIGGAPSTTWPSTRPVIASEMRRVMTAPP